MSKCKATLDGDKITEIKVIMKGSQVFQKSVAGSVGSVKPSQVTEKRNIKEN